MSSMLNGALSWWNRKMEECTILGSLLDREFDIKNRYGLAALTSSKLEQICNSRNKVESLQCLLYNSELWKLILKISEEIDCIQEAMTSCMKRQIKNHGVSKPREEPSADFCHVLLNICQKEGHLTLL